MDRKARRADSQRRYQLKHGGQRHEAYLRRRETGYYHNACPDCREPKSVTATRCRRCSRIFHAAKPRRRPTTPECPYCESTMRQVEWHRRKIMRCPGCGLETTSGELGRIALEEAA
jgi:hypothetical protein